MWSQCDKMWKSSWGMNTFASQCALAHALRSQSTALVSSIFSTLIFLSAYQGGLSRWPLLSTCDCCFRMTPLPPSRLTNALHFPSCKHWPLRAKGQVWPLLQLCNYANHFSNPINKYLCHPNISKIGWGCTCAKQWDSVQSNNLPVIQWEFSDWKASISDYLFSNQHSRSSWPSI